MELHSKPEEQIIEEECKKLANKKLKDDLEKIIGTAYNLLPVGVMPAESYPRIKKGHKYFNERLANIISVAYEGILGAYLVSQPTLSYVQNMTFNGLAPGSQFTAPVFSIMVPEQAFLVAGAYLLLDVTRLAGLYFDKPLGTLAAEAVVHAKDWLKLKLLKRDEKYMNEAMRNITDKLETNRHINSEIEKEDLRKTLCGLQERLYWSEGLYPVEEYELTFRVNELRKQLGMEQITYNKK
ncbi:MAG: hypothetical protein M1348_01615 [Candidatus Parvarchaeota archaeon]|nr:hypothetical protein [Candidatus Parvarchaeota archaeon]MCL5101290.1 hypothetical protein [Candidatus Parvarchaeota archaeon]